MNYEQLKNHFHQEQKKKNSNLVEYLKYISDVKPIFARIVELAQDNTLINGTVVCASLQIDAGMHARPWQRNEYHHWGNYGAIGGVVDTSKYHPVEVVNNDINSEIQKCEKLGIIHNTFRSISNACSGIQSYYVHPLTIIEAMAYCEDHETYKKNAREFLMVKQASELIESEKRFKEWRDYAIQYKEWNKEANERSRYFSKLWRACLVENEVLERNHVKLQSMIATLRLELDKDYNLISLFGSEEETTQLHDYNRVLECQQHSISTQTEQSICDHFISHEYVKRVETIPIYNYKLIKHRRRMLHREYHSAFKFFNRLVQLRYDTPIAVLVLK